MVTGSAFLLVCFSVKVRDSKRAHPGIEPGTSRTLSENHQNPLTHVLCISVLWCAYRLGTQLGSLCRSKVLCDRKSELHSC